MTGEACPRSGFKFNVPLLPFVNRILFVIPTLLFCFAASNGKGAITEGAFKKLQARALVQPKGLDLSVNTRGGKRGGSPGGAGGSVMIKLGTEVDPMPGGIDLSISTTLSAGEHRFRQIFASDNSLKLTIRGEVTIYCQYLFAPNLIVAERDESGNPPRLTVYAGLGLKFESNDKVEASPHVLSVNLAGPSVASTSNVSIDGGSITFICAQPGSIQGSIKTSGGDADEDIGANDGGDAGAVTIASYDVLALSIEANGGAGASGGDGGNGGNVSILARGADGSTATDLFGDNLHFGVIANGGPGGSSKNKPQAERGKDGDIGQGGGSGGNAGSVTVELVGPLPATPVLHAKLNGGPGGNGGDGGGGGRAQVSTDRGGKGGKGGFGGLGGAPGSARVTDDLSQIEAITGTGGMGGDGGFGGEGAIGGAGGDGGDGGPGSGHAPAGVGGRQGISRVGPVVMQEDGQDGQPGNDESLPGRGAPTAPDLELPETEIIAWKGIGEGRVNNPFNWAPHGVPDDQSDVFILSEANLREGSSTVLAIRSLTVDAFSAVVRNVSLNIFDLLSIDEGALTFRSCEPSAERAQWGREGWLSCDNATLTLNGDFRPDSPDTINIRFTPSNSTKPVLKCAGGFHAGGKLNLSTGATEKKFGDTYKLLSFAPTTLRVDEIYRDYRFKDYDPVLGSLLFWGLCFRDEVLPTASSYIEALILQPPMDFHPLFTTPLANGNPLIPGLLGSKITLITHGTSSSIPPDSELSRIAQKFAALADHLSPVPDLSKWWHVTTLEWGPFSTDLTTWNPATSAQRAIGIAESLDYWLRYSQPAFPFRRVHVLGHSSGAWFANRLLELWSADAQVQCTFLDPFVSPGTDCSGPYCGRFDGTLGLGARDDDFVEQYYDQGLGSPPGTRTALPLAINFDVTSAPEHPVVATPIGYHAWPYRWYLKGFDRFMSDPAAAVQKASCGGVVISPIAIEFLTAMGRSDLVSLVALSKSRFATGDIIALDAESCAVHGFAQQVLEKISSAEWQVRGLSETVSEGGEIAGNLPASSQVQFKAQPLPSDAKGIGFWVYVPETDGQTNNGMLSIFQGGKLISRQDIFLFGEPMYSGDIPAAPGEEIAIQIDNIGTNNLIIHVADLEILGNARPKIAFERNLDFLELKFAAESQQVVEYSPSLPALNWQSLTITSPTNVQIRMTNRSGFFRLRRL